MQLRLARAHGDAEHVARLLVAVSKDGAEHEHVPRALGEPVDGGRQVAKVRAVDRQDRRLRCVRNDLQAVLLAFRLAHPSQYRVHADAMHPGTERAVAAKFPDLVPGLDERLLGAVFGFADIARHPQAKRVDPVDVQAIQRLECPRIAVLRAGDERRFVGHFRVEDHLPTIVAGLHRQKCIHPPKLPGSCLFDVRSAHRV